MPKTPNYNFEVYDSSDTTTLFQTYRDAVTGSQTGSNTMLIDGILKQQQDEIDGLNSKPNIVQVQATGINSYVATVEGFAYAEGQVILLAVENTNTGDSTLNINGLGVRPLLKNTASATLAQLNAGDLQQNNLYTFVNRGTNWVIADSDSLTLGGKNGAYYAQDIGKWSAENKGINNDANNIADGVTVCNTNTPIGGQYSYCYVMQSTLDTGIKMQMAVSMYPGTFGMYERRMYTNEWGSWNKVGGTSGKVTLDYSNTAILNKLVTFPGFSADTHNVIATPIYNNTAGVMLRKGMVSVVYGTGAFTVSLVAMQGQTYSSADAGKVEVAYTVQRI